MNIFQPLNSLKERLFAKLYFAQLISLIGYLCTWIGVALLAFEFATWISAEFKFYFIKEFQRLKDDENDRLKLNWNLQRTLAKVNYHNHTDAEKQKYNTCIINSNSKVKCVCK
jgi:phage regulator Rha-like protein